MRRLLAYFQTRPSSLAPPSTKPLVAESLAASHAPSEVLLNPNFSLADRQLPTELWIKIFRHIADLERYPPGVSYPLLPSTQPLAYDTPTIRTLCFTSKYFYDIALPLCYEETSVYYTDTYISGPYRSEPVSHEWVFFDPQTAPLVRTLRWCTFTPAEELARALSSTTNLRYLTMTQNYFSVKLGDLVGIPCLYNVTYLELCGPSYTIDSSNTNFEMFNLRTLALRKPTVDTTEYTLIDNLYRFPRLSELILLAPTADQILYRLISNGSPPLILESLTVLQDMRPTGPLDTQHHLYRYLQERCSDLRTLDIPRLWREPPKLLWKHLPSLRTFCGPTAVAASCISPTSAIEELQLTFSFDYPQWAKSPREELEMISVSPDRLQHLEMSVDAASPDLLEYILDRFPALTSLGFINVKGPPSGPQHSFSTQFPSSYIPSLDNLTAFVITPWPRSQNCHHETVTSQIVWQRPIVKAWGRRNPLLKEMGLYYVGWWKHGRDEQDWGWSLLDPDPWLLDSTSVKV